MRDNIEVKHFEKQKQAYGRCTSLKWNSIPYS